MKQIDKTLTSRVTREKQWDSQSSTSHFSSRNKINYKKRKYNKQCTTTKAIWPDFDLSM